MMIKYLSCFLLLFSPSICAFVSRHQEPLRSHTLRAIRKQPLQLPDRNGHHQQQQVTTDNLQQDMQENLAHLTESLDKKDYASFVQEMTRNIVQEMMDREAKLQRQLDELKEQQQTENPAGIQQLQEELQKEKELSKQANEKLQQQVDQNHKLETELVHIKKKNHPDGINNDNTIRDLQLRVQAEKLARERDSKAAADLLARKNDECRHLRLEAQDEAVRIRAKFQTELEQKDIDMEILKTKLSKAHEATQEKEFVIVELQEDRESIRKLLGASLRLLKSRMQKRFSKLLPNRNQNGKKKLAIPILEAEEDDDDDDQEVEREVQERFEERSTFQKRFLPPLINTKTSFEEENDQHI